MAQTEVPQDLLKRFLDEWTRGDDPRFNELMKALMTHLHQFAWEVRLTEKEWLAALRFLTETGQLCNEWRDEYQLLSDVLGLTTSVNEINHQVPGGITEAAVLGPFYVEGSPALPAGSSIIDSSMDEGEIAIVRGRVLDGDGNGLPGALLDVWQVSPNTLYAVQDENQSPTNLRGIIQTDDDGSYSFVTYKPPAYGIPRDGTVGRLLDLGNRHGMRPAHIHFIVTADGYRPVTTQLFTRDDGYIWSDAVFGEKESLLVDFRPNEDPGIDAAWVVDYDFRLQPVAD